MESTRKAFHPYLIPALVVLVPFLLPFSRLVELPILGLLVIGAYAGWQHRRSLFAPPALLVTALFAGYWLPALFSAVDAVNPGKSWGTVLGLLRFLPVGLCIVLLLDSRQRTWVLDATGLLVSVWAADALFQAAVGFNLLGMPISDDRLNGIFGATNIKLGPVLAALSPLAIEAARRRGNRLLLIGVFALLTATIILIGTRAAWIMFAVVTGCYVVTEIRQGRRWSRIVGLVLILVTTLGLLAYHGSDTLRARFDRSMLLLEGDPAAVDTALSLRLPIWETALDMGAANWINGVGVRGFRYAYPAYADAGDPWVHPGDDTGAYHAHQLLLELWTETGMIGLAAWFATLVWAVRSWLRTGAEARRTALPYGVGLTAMLFPINTHLAFYSTFWSIVFWWLLALFASSLTEFSDRSAES